MKSKQTMENVKSGGAVEQQSSAAADQTMRKIDAAGDVHQIIEITSANMKTIEDELTKLRSALEKYDPNATTELARIKSAEKAAKEGNGAGVVEALRDTAKWVLDFATKIGTSVIAKIIEKQIGLDSAA